MDIFQLSCYLFYFSSYHLQFFNRNSYWLSSMSIYVNIRVCICANVYQTGTSTMFLVTDLIVTWHFQINAKLFISCNLRMYLRWLRTWLDDNNSGLIIIIYRWTDKTVRTKYFKIHNIFVLAIFEFSCCS